MSTLTLGGSTLASKSGSVLSIDSGVTFPSGTPVTGQVHGGHILQVQQKVKTDSWSTAGGLTDVTGMSVSITPSSESNKIFVMLGINFGGSRNLYGYGNVLRDTTVISTSTALSLSSQTNATLALNGTNYDFEYKMKHAVFNYLDSPSSISSLTYKLQLGTYSTNTIYLNRPLYNSNDSWIVGGVSSITVMEIAG